MNHLAPYAKITAEHVEAIAGIYLSQRYDSPQPTPDFHRECWELYCSDHQQCAIAAPRNHAKSTALTHDFILAMVLLRVETYVILVSASEDLAIEHLSDIANELRENDLLQRDFKIKGFVQDQKTDIIVECVDGWQFRIIARGAEQKIRGRKWRGRRPGLVVADDLEDDEQVENKDRRAKFRKWFFRACKQALRDGGKIRAHGTILHVDSLLNRLMKNPTWRHKKYRAHKSMNDFSEILWPEKFPESRLRAIKAEFVAEGDTAGYSQEYLNDPIDEDNKFIRSEWFIPMSEEDHECFKRMVVGIDWALSKQDHANKTSFAIGGKDTTNITHIVDLHCSRWNSAEIIDEFFDIYDRWHPDVYYAEHGKEWLAIEPILNKEMVKRNKFLNVETFVPIKDKKIRARAFQKRMKVGAVRWDDKASWYEETKEECLLFTGDSEAISDDRFDSLATMFIGLEQASEVDPDEEWTEEQAEFEAQVRVLQHGGDGRSQITGY